MKWTAVALLVVALLQAGCSREDEHISLLQAQLNEATASVNALEDRLLEGSDVESGLRRQLEAARRESSELRAQLDEAAALVVPDETEPLKREIAELHKRIAELESKPDPEPEAEPAPEPAASSEASAEHLRRLDELIPAVKANSGGQELDELWELASRGNKALRDELIRRLREWSSAEPTNSRARLALATALTTRFADLEGQFMKQGELAGEVKKEIEKALEIDPDYYDAVHFLALLKANYPPFADEFKTAHVELAKAIEMQSGLPWEERFCDIYTMYAGWHRKQNKLDDAMKKVEEGLQKSAQNEGLLAEKARIEAARSGQGD